MTCCDAYFLLSLSSDNDYNDREHHTLYGDAEEEEILW